MHVLLFDIDGTLINTRGSGLLALQLAFQELCGRAAPDKIDTYGCTDRGIARDLFQMHLLPDCADNWQRFNQAYLRHLAEQLPRRDGYVLPGVASLLETLARRSDVVLGLLTGNTPQGARIKLEYFGIYDHFRFGGFGADHPERNAVAEAALCAARQQVNHELVLERVWVIGDTPRDVACARHVGARAVAVASGWHARDVLAEHRPDLLLDDLRHPEPLLSLLDAAAESRTET